MSCCPVYVPVWPGLQMECQPVQLVDGVRRSMNLAKTKLMFQQSDVHSLKLVQCVTLIRFAHRNMLQGIVKTSEIYSGIYLH
jgi:hypothetical protein